VSSSKETTHSLLDVACLRLRSRAAFKRTPHTAPQLRINRPSAVRLRGAHGAGNAAGKNGQREERRSRVWGDEGPIQAWMVSKVVRLRHWGVFAQYITAESVLRPGRVILDRMPEIS